MIEIRITADSGVDALAQMRELLGGTLPAAPAETFDIKVDAFKAADDSAGRLTVAAEPAKRTRRTKAELTQISTGDERVGPEDTPEDAAQDAADEKAEVEASREPAKPLTVDDVKNAIGPYVAKHGMAAVQEDGPGIFLSALGNPPAGEAGWKISLLASASQEQLAKAVSTWQAACAAEGRTKSAG